LPEYEERPVPPLARLRVPLSDGAKVKGTGSVGDVEAGG